MRLGLVFWFIFLTISAFGQKKLSQKDSIGSFQLKTAERIRQEGNRLYIDQSYEQALEKYNKALRIFEDYGDSLGVAKCFNNIGISNMSLENNQEAVSAFYRVIEINRALKNSNSLVSNYVNLAAYYKKQKELTLAFDYFQSNKNEQKWERLLFLSLL